MHCQRYVHSLATAGRTSQGVELSVIEESLSDVEDEAGEE
jgi:hypothetical protein